MSLKLKTILGIAAIEIALLAILVLTSLGHLKSSNEELFLQRSAIAKQLFATMVSDSVLSFDLATLDSLIANALKNREILYIRVRDANGRILAVGGQEAALKAKFNPPRNLDEARAIGRFDVAHALTVAGKNFGRVEMGMSLANTETAIASARKWLLSLSLIEVMLVALFSYVIGNMVTRRIGTLQQAARQVANGEFGIQVPEAGRDELSRFAQDFNRMSLALSDHEKELRESQDRLAATVRSALDGVIVADAQGRIIEFNDQASACFGYARDYAIGRDLAELIIPERMRAMHSAGMKRYLESGQAKIVGQRIEIDALHAEGHEFPVELAVGAAQSGGGKIFVAYVRDISERRRNEQDLQLARENAEAADQAKSRFLAVMSHEMRTPLNGITGVLQILRDTPLRDDQRDLIATADRSGELLLDLINDVLDLSKMEAGKLHLNTSDFAPDDLFLRITEIMKLELEGRNNTLTTHVDDNVPALLHGDGKRIVQILLNLTSNANKFTNGGHIHMTMGLAQVKGEHAVLEFSVTDTGIGIPEDRVKNVFSEFTSLEDSYNRRQGGTGLGLSICKNLLDLMDGSIHVESALGEGSRFWFQVPLPIVQPMDQPAPGDDVVSCQARTIKSARILLAEDNPTNAMVAKTILTKAGHEVEHVVDGEQAFAAVRATAFDIVLMDISMPGMDGIEATHLIRKLPTAAAGVPIVAMTAHSLSGDKERFLEAGMNDCVTKPIRKELLIKAIEDHVVRIFESEDDSLDIEPSTVDDEVFDQSEIAQLCKDVGAELVPSLLEQFAADVEARAKAVHDGVAARDLKAAQAAAHAIKGSAATLGARKLSACAAHIETICAQAKWHEIEQAMDDFAPLQLAAVEYAKNFTGTAH